MKKLLSLLILSTILVSCGTSNNVVNNGIFQKRKHTSGWFIKKRQGVEKKSANEESLAFEENIKKEKSSEETSIASNDFKASEVIKSNDKNLVSTAIVAEKKKTDVKEKRSSIRNKSLIASSRSNDKKEITTQNFGDQEKETKINANDKKNSTNSSSDVAIILLVILCFILPPLAVWLASSDTTQLIISIILTLLFWLPGIIHALLVVFGVI